MGEVVGFLRAPSPQRASAFQHFLHGLQRWVLLLGRGGRPGGGERSHMALVLFLQSFSRLTAKAPRWRSRIKARSAFHRLREKFLQSRKSSSSSEALFCQCGFCGHGPLSPLIHVLGLFLSRRGASGDVSLPPLSRRVGSDMPSPLDD